MKRILGSISPPYEVEERTKQPHTEYADAGMSRRIQTNSGRLTDPRGADRLFQKLSSRRPQTLNIVRSPSSSSFQWNSGIGFLTYMQITFEISSLSPSISLLLPLLRRTDTHFPTASERPSPEKQLRIASSCMNKEGREEKEREGETVHVI